MYILLLHTQVIGLGTLGLVYTLSTEALPRMEATRGKVKAWRVDSLRSGDLEEVNSKAIVPVSNSDSKIKVLQRSWDLDTAWGLGSGNPGGGQGSAHWTSQGGPAEESLKQCH